MRSIWKGAISFGLVNIPVALYSASQARELKFKLLHKKDLSEIRYARICKADGKEVPWEEIVKGYPTQEGEYAIMSDEDFERANVKKNKTIEITGFAFEKEIDPIYYSNSYYLEPGKSAGKAYSLLHEALKKSKKSAICQFVIHNREHLALIRPYGNFLILHQLHYHSEIRSTKELEIQPLKNLSKELSIALKLIEELTIRFDAKRYSDTYIDELKEAIQNKIKGKKVKHSKISQDQSSKIHDIMNLLDQSLKKVKKRKTA